MLGKTIGNTHGKANKTRDYSPKHQSCNSPAKGKGKGDAAYHANGRPWSRSGQEIDQKA